MRLDAAICDQRAEAHWQKLRASTIIKEVEAINGNGQGRSMAATVHSTPIRETPYEADMTRPPLTELRAKAGRLGGESKSAAKQSAARMNGSHGGRPKNVDQ